MKRRAVKERQNRKRLSKSLHKYWCGLAAYYKGQAEGRRGVCMYLCSTKVDCFISRMDRNDMDFKEFIAKFREFLIINGYEFEGCITKGCGVEAKNEREDE